VAEIIPFPVDKIDRKPDSLDLAPVKILRFPVFYRVPDREFIEPSDPDYFGTYTPQAPYNSKKPESKQ
jgi:hypothetical protein